MSSQPIAVITPYRDEPIEYLARCYESVKSQSVATIHFFVGDGPDAADLAFEGIRRFRLPRAANDYGEGPRHFGAQLATAEKVAGIAFLDADNWWHSNHLKSIWSLHIQAQSNICTSRRTIHHIDGRLLGYCHTSDGVHFSDTNCTTFFGSAMRWALFSASVPSELKPIHDRVLWAAIRSSGERTAHSGLYTAAYRTKFRRHYDLCGITPPNGVHKSTLAIQEALAVWQQRQGQSLAFNHEISQTQ